MEEWIVLCTLVSAASLAFKQVRHCLAWVWNKTFGRRGVQLDRIEAELRPNGGSSIRDVIDRIEAKQAGFEAYLTAQMNLQKLAILRTDAKGKLTAINRHYQKLLGVSLQEVEGDGWINVLHPDNREKIIEKWQNAINSQIEFSEDIHYITSDGKDFWAHSHVYREISARGQVLGYLGVIIPHDSDPVCPHVNLCKVGVKAMSHSHE